MSDIHPQNIVSFIRPKGRAVRYRKIRSWFGMCLYVCIAAPDQSTQATVQEGSQGGRQSYRVQRKLYFHRGYSFSTYKYMIYNQAFKRKS